MEIRLSPAALAFVAAHGAALTVQSVVTSSCCGAPLPPEVKPGAPRDPEGFRAIPAGDLTVYFDSLLEEPPVLAIDLQDYGRYRELTVQDW